MEKHPNIKALLDIGKTINEAGFKVSEYGSALNKFLSKGKIKPAKSKFHN